MQASVLLIFAKRGMFRAPKRRIEPSSQWAGELVLSDLHNELHPIA
jgi:hypothetical protein